MEKLLLSLFVLAVSVASAKTYSITLFQNSTVGETELKAGQYRLELNDTSVVIKNRSQKAESPVKVENSQERFGSTTVRYVRSEGKLRVEEIRLGGTKLKLVFN